MDITSNWVRGTYEVKNCCVIAKEEWIKNRRHKLNHWDFPVAIFPTCTILPISNIASDAAADVWAFSVGTEGVLVAAICFISGTFICI